MTMKTQQSSQQRGFSMIEVAVSMAVMGILMASVAPSVSIWMGNTRIRNTAESIMTGLQKARAEAVRRNQTVRFSMVSLTNPKVLDNTCTLSATGGSWVVSTGSPTNKCATAPSTSDTLMLVDAHPVGDGGDGVSVSAKQSDGTTGATSVAFNAFGQVISGTDALTGSNPIASISVVSSTSNSEYRQLKLVVSTGGRVVMCDQAVTDATDTRYCPAS
jgi:type IV fimbrial biogenesis protein FimT